MKNLWKSIPLPTLYNWLWGLLAIIVSFIYIDNEWHFQRHAIYYGLVTPWVISYADTRPFRQGIRWISGIISLLFSQIFIIGQRFYFNHEWSDCFDSHISILLWIAQSICYGYVFYKLNLVILGFFEQPNHSEKGNSINLRHWFWTILGVKLLYFAAFFPCIFGFDAAVGLRTLLDPNSAACNHHPYFIQLIHALAFSSGKAIGHASWGFAILTLAFCLFSSKILVYGLRLISQAGLSRRWRLIFASVYAFFPLFPYLSVYTTKDGIFAYALLLFIYNVYELYLSQGRCLHNWKYLLILSLAILLVCLTRHQGIYLILPVIVLLLWTYRSCWQRLVFSVVSPLVCFFFFNSCLLPHLNVEPGGRQEKYGFLFQQTAYYLIQHPKDVTVEEQNAIDAILDRSVITENYRFYISDPVKRTYKFNPWFRPYTKGLSQFRHVNHTEESALMKEYIAAWFSMGCRHPLTYLKAFVANTLGFFYDMGDPLIEIEPNWAENGSATTDDYSFFHVNRAVTIYFNRIYQVLAIPFVCWLFAIPYYNWLAILLISLLLLRKDLSGLSIFLPILLSIFVLFICPVAYGRYMYPIVAALPMLFAYILINRQQRVPGK